MGQLGLVAPVLALLLPGCLAATAVSVIGSGLVAGASLAGKTVYYTGKGVYEIGKLTVRVVGGSLDGSEQRLRLTILSQDGSGNPIRTIRDIDAADLETELESIEASGDQSQVIVEVLS